MAGDWEEGVSFPHMAAAPASLGLLAQAGLVVPRVVAVPRWVKVFAEGCCRRMEVEEHGPSGWKARRG